MRTIVIKNLSTIEDVFAVAMVDTHLHILRQREWGIKANSWTELFAKQQDDNKVEIKVKGPDPIDGKIVYTITDREDETEEQA